MKKLDVMVALARWLDTVPDQCLDCSSNITTFRIEFLGEFIEGTTHEDHYITCPNLTDCVKDCEICLVCGAPDGKILPGCPDCNQCLDDLDIEV